MPPGTDLLQGTLDLLILKTLALEPMHGWGVSPSASSSFPGRCCKSVKGRSTRPGIAWNTRGGFGPIGADPRTTAKFYSLTRRGRKQLESELEIWDRLAAAVALVLGRTPQASS